MTEKTDRQRWMGLLAKASAEDLAELWAARGDSPAFEWLRAPETGAVMVRARTGGSGAPFNLGEMTVTRCALQLDTGEVGHAYVQGRDKAKARIAALIDALMQTPAAGALEDAVLTPLTERATAAKARRAGKAAATKVEFFALARGEDP